MFGKWHTEVVCAENIPMMVRNGQERLFLQEASMSCRREPHDARAEMARELFPPTQPTVATAELEHSIFLAGKHSEEQLLKSDLTVSTEETGKQVGFDVICNRRHNNC